MKRQPDFQAENFIRERKRNNRLRRAIALLCAVVMLLTMNSLKMNADTLEHIPGCGLEEHKHTLACYPLLCPLAEAEPQYEIRRAFIGDLHPHIHSEDCYDDNGVLACGYAESLYYHVHNRWCYDDDGNLVCGLNEIRPHQHTEACYQDVPTLVCGQDEYPAHHHTEECYFTVRELACGMEENPGHIHTDACYFDHNELTCGLEESVGHVHTSECYIPVVETTCGMEEGPGHIHTEECYTRELICGELESEEHQHTDECYADVLTCEIPEGFGAHTHTESCYTVYNILVCGIPEGEGAHRHTKDCVTSYHTLICGIPESEGAHTHTDSCYIDYDYLVCGQEETEGHTHTEECYEHSLEMICGEQDGSEWVATMLGQEGVQVHTHTDECFTTFTRTLENGEERTLRFATCGYLEIPTLVTQESDWTSYPVMISEGHTHTAACYDLDAEPICGMVEHEHTDACYQTRPVKTEAPAEGELIPAEGGNGDADSADLADLTEGTDSENGENETNDLSDETTAETNAGGDLDEGENETPVNNDENETADQEQTEVENLEQTEVGNDEGDADVNAPANGELSNNEDADITDGEPTDDGEPSDNELADITDGEPADGELSNNEDADITDGEPIDGEPSDNELADITDGEPADDGEPSDNELADITDGEPADGELSNNEDADITDGEPADDGELSDNEPADIADGEPADDGGEPSDNEPADIVDGEPIDGEPSDNEPADILDGEPADDGEPSDNEPADITDGEPTDDSEPTDNEPADITDGEPADDGEPSDNEPADITDGEPTDGDEETRSGDVASPAEDAPADAEPSDEETTDTDAADKTDEELADGELTDGEPADGEPADEETADEEPAEFTAGERVIEVNNGSVTLAWGPEAEIPEDVRVEVVEIERGTPEYDILYNNAMAALSEKKDTETTTQVMRFFDITLYDGEEKFEPKAAISVTVKVDEAEATENDEDVDAIHMENVGAEAEVVEATTDSDTVSFEAESFSIYGVVVDVPATPAEEPPVSVAVDLSSVDLMAAAEVTDTVALSIPELLAGTDENAVKVEGELGVDPEALQDAKVTAPEGVQVDGDKLVLSADALESGVVSLEVTTYATEEYETIATTHKVDIELNDYQGRTDAAEGENITVTALEGNSLPADAVATAQQVEPAEAAAEPADADTDEIREGDVASPAEPAPAEEGSLPEGAGSPQGETEGVNPSDADEADAPADALDVPSDEESDNADDTENKEASASDDIDATAETISDTISGAVAYDITITNANEDVIAETGMVEVALRPENVNIYEGLPANAIVTNVTYTLIHEHEGETQELPVDVDVDEAGNVTEFRFQVDKFSTSTLRYTVDFYYGDYEFHIPGEGYILLSRLFNVLHIQADAAEAVSVEFTDPSLVAVYHVEQDVALSQVFAEVGSPRAVQADAVDAEVETASEGELGEDGEVVPAESDAAEEAVGEASDEDTILSAVDWLLVSLQPFTSHETLTVTMADGTVYVIQVEDAQVHNDYYWTIVNNGNLGYLTFAGKSTKLINITNYDDPVYNTTTYANHIYDTHVHDFHLVEYKDPVNGSGAATGTGTKGGARFALWLKCKDGEYTRVGGNNDYLNYGSRGALENAVFVAFFAPSENDKVIVVNTEKYDDLGSVTVSGEGFRYPYNRSGQYIEERQAAYVYSTDNVTLTATAKGNNFFAGWYRHDGSLYSMNSTLNSSDIEADIILTPVFKQNYNYTVVSNTLVHKVYKDNNNHSLGTEEVTLESGSFSILDWNDWDTHRSHDEHYTHVWNLGTEPVPNAGVSSFRYDVHTQPLSSDFQFAYWLRDDGTTPVTEGSTLVGFEKDGVVRNEYNDIERDTTFVAFYRWDNDYIIRVNQASEGGKYENQANWYWLSEYGGPRTVKVNGKDMFPYYYAKDHAVIEAKPNSGWYFDGWYNNGTQKISADPVLNIYDYVYGNAGAGIEAHPGDLNLTPVFKKIQAYYNVWFDGTDGVAGGELSDGYNNTFYANTKRSDDSSTSWYMKVAKPGFTESNPGADYQTTITLPTAAEVHKPQSQSLNGYVLQGWYEIYTDQYYLPGDPVTIHADAVFYADWMPGSYDIGKDDGRLSNKVIDTNGFITTRVFDYNNLFNVGPNGSAYLDLGQSVSSMPASAQDLAYGQIKTDVPFAEYNKEYWYMKGTANDFVFMTTVAGKGRSMNPFGRELKNQNRETTRNGTYFSAIPTQGLMSIDGLRNKLFGTSDITPGKKYLGTANFLYSYDDDTGYYYYDSDKNAASYNQSQSRFYVYDYKNKTNKSNGGDNADFLPLNYDEREFVEGNGAPNYWFGMSSAINFYLPNATGYTDNNDKTGNRSVKGDEMIYKFAGDDDVWVYVDDDLILDMGGVHGKIYGEINFSTGKWKIVYNGANKTTDNHGYMTYQEGTGSVLEGNLNITEGDHTLTLYYLERGASQSNCAIYFNLAPRYALQLHKVDSEDSTKSLGGAVFGVYADEACTVAANVWDSKTGAKTNLFTTAESGNDEGYAFVSGLAAGKTYYIKEVSAPANYPDVSEEIIKLVLDSDGTPHVTSTADNGSVWTMAEVEKSNVAGEFLLTMTVKNNPETSITAQKIWAMIDGSQYARDEDSWVKVKLQRYTLSGTQSSSNVPNYTVRLITRYCADSNGRPINSNDGSVVTYTTDSETVSRGGSITFDVEASSGAGILSVIPQYGRLAGDFTTYTTGRPFYIDSGYANAATAGTFTLSRVYRNTDIYITYIGNAESAAALGTSIGNIVIKAGDGTSYEKVEDRKFNEEAVETSNGEQLEVLLNKDNNWKTTWSELESQNNSGGKYYYYVIETGSSSKLTTNPLLTDIPAYVKTTSSDGLSGGTITVRNTLSAIKVKLRKYDRSNNKKNLQGAQFKIYTSVEYEDKGYRGTDVSVIEENATTSAWLEEQTYDETNHVFVSNSEGKFYTGYLPLGTYYLVETGAPTGYKKLDEAVKIRVTENGLQYWDEASNRWLSRNIDEHGYYNLYIDNEEVGSLKITKAVTVNDANVAGSAPTLADGDYQFNIYAYDDTADGMKGALVEGSPVTIKITNGIGNSVVVGNLAAGKYVVEELPAANGAELKTSVSGDSTIQTGVAEGAVIVTVVAGVNEPSEITAVASFTNNLDTTYIEVDKLWADGNDNHTDDTVTMKLYKYYGDAVIDEDLVTLTVHAGGSMPTDGTSAIVVSIDGTPYTLNAANSWTAMVRGILRGSIHDVQVSSCAGDITSATVGTPTTSASGNISYAVTPTISTGAANITVTLTDADSKATGVTATINGQDIPLNKNGNTYTVEVTGLTRGQTYPVTFAGTASDGYIVTIEEDSVTVPYGAKAEVNVSGEVTSNVVYGAADITVTLTDNDGKATAVTATIDGRTIDLSKDGNTYTGSVTGLVRDHEYTASFTGTASDDYTVTIPSASVTWPASGNGTVSATGTVTGSSNPEPGTTKIRITVNSDQVTWLNLGINGSTHTNYATIHGIGGIDKAVTNGETKEITLSYTQAPDITYYQVNVYYLGNTNGYTPVFTGGGVSYRGTTVYIPINVTSITLTLAPNNYTFASSTQLARVPFQMVPSSEFIVEDKGFSIADLFFPTAYADSEISVYNKLEANDAIAVTAAERDDFEVVLNSTTTPSQGIAVEGWGYTWSDLPKTEMVDGVVRYVYYLVEEKETSNQNVESVSYSYDEPDGEARYHVVTVTNTEKKGELTVTKTVSGTNVGTYSIGVHDAKRHYYNLDGTDKGTEPFYVTFVMNQSRTWSNLLKGTYTVVEQDASEDGYTWTYSGTGDIEVTAGGKASKTVNNDYEEKPGSLKIQKTVQVNGQTPTTARDMALVQGDYVFTIASTTLSPQVTRQITIHFNENGVATSVTGDEYATLEDGVVTVANLKADAYTVTEQTPTNGTSLVSGIANPQTVTVSKGDIEQVQTAAFTNNIDTGELSLTKTVSGKTDNTTAFSFDISLTAPEGVTLATSYPAVHTGDNTLSSVAVSVSTDADTGRSIGTITGILLKHDQTIAISDLPAGTAYVIAETGSYTGFHKGTVNNESGVIPARTKIEADIQNVFTAEDDVPFYANKHFANGDLNGKQFAFRLTQIAEIPASGEAVQATENVKLASSQVIHTEQKNGNNQTVAFTEITFNQDDIGKTFYFMIDEAEIPANLDADNISDHIQYDTTKHYFTVVIGEEDGKLTIAKTPSVSGDDETTAKFTNTQLGKLIVTKTFDGTAAADLADEQKEAILFSVTGPAGFTAIENRPLSDSSFVLESGVYTLTLDNIPLGNYTVTESNTAIGNYRLTSSIEVDGTTSAVGAAELTAADIDREVAFTNTYDKYELEVTKSFTGAELTDEQKANISFTVSGTDLTGTLTHTYAEIANMDDGKWVLTTADNNIKPGVAYTVTETNANLNGYTLTTTYKVNGADAEVPTVTLENSQYTGASIELINHYRDAKLIITKTIAGIEPNMAADSITFTVTDAQGYKLLDKVALSNALFTLSETTYTATLRSTDDAAYAQYLVPGGVYTVTETATDPEGHTLKSTTYKVTGSAVQTGMEGSVTLDSGDPTSSGEIDFTNIYTTPTSYTPGVDKALVWKNTEPAVAVDPSKWPEKGFTFTLAAVGGTDAGGNAIAVADVPMPVGFTQTIKYITGTNGEPERVTDPEFGEIPYTAAGTYNYTITETVPDGAVNETTGETWAATDAQKAAGGLWKLNGITYNASPVTVVVTVTEDETTHALSAAATYGGATVNAATITNTYETTSTDAPVEVTKALVWKDTEAQIPADAKWPANGFEFKLAYVSGVGENGDFQDMDDAGVTLPENTAVSAYVTAKVANFGDIHFEKAGVFTFTLTETVPDEAIAIINESEVTWAGADDAKKQACGYRFRKNGITYDGEPKTVTITVVDINGVLAASVAYTSANAASLTVTNTYDTRPTSYRPKADKVLMQGESVAASSRWPSEGFTFTLAAASDEPMPVAEDGSEGCTAVTITMEAGNKVMNPTLGFDAIPYNAAGTYNYTITETVPNNAVNEAGVTWANATPEQKAAGGFRKDGITYNNTPVTVQVVVEDVSGVLTVTSVIYDGEESKNNAIGEATATVKNKVELTDFEFNKKWFSSFETLEAMGWPTDVDSIEVTIRRRLLYIDAKAEPTPGYTNSDDSFIMVYTLTPTSGTGADLPVLTVTVKDNVYNYKLSDLEKYGRYDDHEGEWEYFVSETSLDTYSTIYKDADGNQINGAEQTRDGGTIENRFVTYTLPSTGGMGTTTIYIAGASLLILAVLGFIWLNRKRDDGAGI